ncbi:MAG: MMPL family transporter [Clostridia bacterium]|nr:MMPL family transporter [Clostridia bacterium]
MKKFFRFIVEKRIWLFLATLIATIVCALLIPSVQVNYDMTVYLPEKSNMKQGLDIMTIEFSQEQTEDEFKLMFKNLTDEEKKEIDLFLNLFPGVKTIKTGDGADYNKDGYTLFIVVSAYSDHQKTERCMKEIVNELKKDYEVYSYYKNTQERLMINLIPTAVFLIVVILFLVCKAFIEPLLVLSTIAVSVLLNLGTNAFLPQVSYITFTLSSVLQIILCIDYSMILIHRFAQEKQLNPEEKNTAVMYSAFFHSFGSVTSSAFTTLVGLLALAFMSFTIGADIGLVLGKGVLLSFITSFTFLPAITLWSEKLLQKTNKGHLLSAFKKKKQGGKDHV